MVNFLTVPLTKDYVLKRVSQEKIFKYYLGIDKIQTKGLFRSPLREDKEPTCSFTYLENGRLLYRDWAYENSKDCFGIVQDIYGLNFDEALKKIAADFDLTDRSPQENLVKRVKKRKSTNSQSTGPSRATIHASKGKFTKKHVEYLKSYGITKEATKKFYCFPLSKVWVNGDAIWHYDKDDPALGYYFGTDKRGNQKWKIYFYERDEYRFLGNTIRLQGYPQLPMTGDHLVITKSMKDVMSLWEFGVTAVAPQNETTLISSQRVKEFKQRFNKLFSLYDFDYTGVKTANRMRRQYGIPRLFLTNGRFGYKDYEVKDFSDFVKYHGEEKAVELVKKAKSKIL